MKDGSNNRRRDELDRFWDIDALIPPKRMPQYASDTEATEIVLDESNQTKQPQDARGAIPPRDPNAPKRHFIPPHTEDEERRAPRPDEEYLSEHALIGQVRLFRWKSVYAYYEAFVRDAVRLYPIHGVTCEPVSFFSYVPQYTQMSRAQLEWYLWWRECVRRGEYPQTDYSYILLYAYELINLSDRIDPAVGQRELTKLWIHYRELFRQLDSYLPEWICDYSLIHRLLPPAELTDAQRTELMRHCVLKEFYLPHDNENAFVNALMFFCSNYDYRKSKFCTEEQAARFDSVIPKALRRVIAETEEGAAVFASVGAEQSKMIRDSFTGALCSYRIKRKIEVEYRAVSRTHEVRCFVTDVIKYTENRLRASLGIRSRLGVSALSSAVRAKIDQITAPLLPVHRSSAEATEGTAPYEHLYDLPRVPLSLSNAAAIEQSSWNTTERLIEAFADEQVSEEHAEPASTPPASPADAATSEMQSDVACVAGYFPLLRALLSGDRAAQQAYLREAGGIWEVLIDEINAAFYDYMGDVLLEESEDGYGVIEDYRAWLEGMLSDNGF